MALDEKLTEEERTRLIKEFIHKRRKALISDAYKQLVEGNQDDYTRLGASYHLYELAEIDHREYIHLFNLCIHSEEYTRMSAIRGLESLAETNTSLFLKLYETATSSDNQSTIQMFSMVKFDKLQDRPLFSKDKTQEKSSQYTGDLDFIIKRLLKQLPGRSVVEFNSLIKKSEPQKMSTSDLGAFVELCEEKTHDAHQGHKLSMIYYLPLLAIIDFDKAITLYLQYSKDIDHVVRKIAAERFRDLISLWKTDCFPVKNDGATEFLTSYFNSEYYSCKEWDSTEKINRLYSIKNTDFKKLSRILEVGEIKDFDELLECNSIDSPYLCISKLGKGKGGLTYKVYSEALKQYSAIKLIALNKVNLQEAALMARLKGQDLENIVQIYDGGNHLVDGEYAILMEYVDGQTLEEILHERKLTPHEVLDYSAQILNGIKSLRKHGITHRDLNLRNIKVNSQGEVKILDFGIATDEFHPKAKDNRKYGAPKDMEADDLISFGLLVYKMIIGEHLVDVPGKETMGSGTYADEIDRIKQSLYRNGKITEEYDKKIWGISSDDYDPLHDDYTNCTHEEHNIKSLLGDIIRSALWEKEFKILTGKYPTPYTFKIMDAKELRQLLFLSMKDGEKLAFDNYVLYCKVKPD